MKPISIVIPVRRSDSPEVTLRALAKQTNQDFDVIVSWQEDESKGVNFARNRGAELAGGGFILFSDGDIEWESDALQAMLNALAKNPAASYAYGSYSMGGKIQCNVDFDAARMKKANFVSTMALIRREHFPGFDEDVLRLTDWALFLRMLIYHGRVGVYVGKLTFKTELRDGITQNGPVSYLEARAYVRKKFNLPMTSEDRAAGARA